MRNLGTAGLMRYLQHNQANQIFGSASSNDTALPATAEWQATYWACTENEEHNRGRRGLLCPALPSLFHCGYPSRSLLYIQANICLQSCKIQNDQEMQG